MNAGWRRRCCNCPDAHAPICSLLITPSLFSAGPLSQAFHDRSCAAAPTPLPSNPTRQFFGHDSLRLANRDFPTNFRTGILPRPLLHLLQHSISKLRASQTPPPAYRLELLLVLLGHRALFHPALKFLPSGSSIFLDAVLAQQAVHPDPSGPMFLGRDIPHQTAPWIAQQPILRSNPVGTNRIEMHVITDRL